MSHEHDLGEPDRPYDVDEPLVRPIGDDDAPAVSEPVASEPAGSASAEPSEPAAAPSASVVAGPQTPETGARGRDRTPTMLPNRRNRSAVESLFVRLIATAGVVGVGVAIAAIMGSSHSKGWLVGLVVSIVSVVLAAILWSSRQL
jgi:hypothetical protein